MYVQVVLLFLFCHLSKCAAFARLEEHNRGRHDHRAGPETLRQETYDRHRHSNDHPSTSRYEPAYRQQPDRRWADYRARYIIHACRRAQPKCKFKQVSSCNTAMVAAQPSMLVDLHACPACSVVCIRCVLATICRSALLVTTAALTCMPAQLDLQWLW